MPVLNKPNNILYLFNYRLYIDKNLIKEHY